MITKDHILAEIRRTASENAGKPFGVTRFSEATGITKSDWFGKFWARWGDALREAGFKENALQGPRDQSDVLSALSDFVLELGRFPVSAELRLRARTHPGFPWHNTFFRHGGKRGLALRLREYAQNNDVQAAVAACDEVLAALPQSDPDTRPQEATVVGYVYLLKSAGFYKIGRTNAVGRRERELAIQLPEKAVTVHSIKTDDPAGIEAYWHNRFRDRRRNGEWFELSAADVTAFKRRKFM